MGYVRKILKNQIFQYNLIFGLMLGVALLPPLYSNKRIKQNFDKIINYTMKYGSFDGKIYILSADNMTIKIVEQKKVYKNSLFPDRPHSRIQYYSIDYLDSFSDGFGDHYTGEYFRSDDFEYDFDNTYLSRFRASWRAKNLTDKIVENLNLDNLKIN